MWDQILVLKQLVEECKEERKESCIEFIDCRKAYDRDCKEELWN